MSVALLTLAIGANAQWTRNAVTGVTSLTFPTDKVGIGTPSPSFSLDIKQDANCSFRVQSKVSGSSNLILSRSISTTNCLVNYKTGLTDLWFTGCANNDDFRIRSAAGLDRIFISQTTGFVGINNTAPTQNLEVYGNIASTLGDFYTSNANGVVNCGFGVQNEEINIMADGDLHTIVDGDEDLYIGEDIEIGNAAYKPGGGSWTTISDARLKKDIKSYDDGLAQLMKINPVTFKYNDKVKLNNADKEYVGIIAQDMQKIAPYMIEEKALFSKSHEDKNGNVVVDDAGQNYLTYDGSALTYMLVNAVKEQQSQIEELKAIVATYQETGAMKGKALANNLNTSMLFQNSPNPFNQTTIIRYALNAESSNGTIVIRDLNGNQVKQISITESGKGQVVINANELTQGTYTYTLEVAGQSLDTKLMVVTK